MADGAIIRPIFPSMYMTMDGDSTIGAGVASVGVGTIHGYGMVDGAGTLVGAGEASVGVGTTHGDGTVGAGTPVGAGVASASDGTTGVGTIWAGEATAGTTVIIIAM